jgi:hypothetical protein
MGTLELISSRNCLIHSLVVVDNPDMPITVPSFQNLNLTQLQELALVKSRWDQSRGIMDLALQSSSRAISFDIRNCWLTLDLFKHELLQRVADIGISFRQ